jgi:hypothetical protein
MKQAYWLVALSSIMGACLLGSSARAADSPNIAVYVSEANAAVYHGQYQDRLSDWLGSLGLKFTKIGDKQASDGSALQGFAVILATNTYIVPDNACAGLAQYVTAGGRLIWIDGPVRTKNAQLRATLGLGDESTYAVIKDAHFKMLLPDNPACAGIRDFTCPATGNSYFATTGQTLATFAGQIGPQDQRKEAARL